MTDDLRERVLIEQRDTLRVMLSREVQKREQAEAERAALAADVLELRACLRDLLDAQQFEGLGYGDREEGGPNAQGWIAATAAAEARLAGAAGAEGE